MSKIIDLSGEWSFRSENTPHGVIEANGTVPGCVHTDLINNGIFKDIFYRDNSLGVQWIENCDFTYTREFFVEELSKNSYIEFDGLDTYADVYLNGVKIGESDDMFISHAFSADGALRSGKNVLEVRFYSPIKRVEGMPLYEGAFTKERMNTRRMQCTYSWDWVDRFVTMGIYRPVRLSFREKNEIDNVYIYTEDINPYAAEVRLDIAIRDFESCADSVFIEVKAPDGSVVFAKKRTLINPVLHERIHVRNPELWYPVGYGAQPLYTFTVSTETSVKSEKIGIRRITVLEAVDEEGSDERRESLKLQTMPHFSEMDLNEQTASFIVLVNGVKIMCKGGDWVPCDPFPSSESPEKITRLLELAVQAGVNMIRVWGGGIFERDEFYSECDRLGILVTQDFLMACGEYPEREAWFIEALKRETREAALRLRNHASLVYWCGDNENAVRGSENRTGFPGYLSATYGIEPVLAELDPHRYFFPSSPYGGDNYCSVTRGTTHITNYLGAIFEYMLNSDMKDYREFFSSFYSRFCCEYPAFGMSFASSLEKYLAKADIFDDEKMDMIEFHSKDNPSLGKPLFRMYADVAEKIFGAFGDGEDRIRKYQMVHSEMIRISMELHRRKKGYNWGIIYWMLNDCWPAAAGWSLLDYYACPKPSYYTFKRGAKPVISTISLEDGRLSLHVCNDAMSRVSGSARLYVYDFKAKCELYCENIPFSIAENASEKVFECDFAVFDAYLSESSLVMCDLVSELCEDRSFFIKDRYCDLDISYTEPNVILENETSISVTTDKFNPYVVLDVPYVLSDNCFALKPGEVKTLEKLSKI